MAKSSMVIARRRVAAGQAQTLHEEGDGERRRARKKAAPVVARGRRASDREPQPAVSRAKTSVKRDGREAARNGGAFQASVSKTLPVSIDAAFAAWSEAANRWLDAPGLSFTQVDRGGRNIRAHWPDGTRIDVRFAVKGPGKVRIVADTRRLGSAAAAAAAKSLWQSQFGRLWRYLGL